MITKGLSKHTKDLLINDDFYFTKPITKPDYLKLVFTLKIVMMYFFLALPVFSVMPTIKYSAELKAGSKTAITWNKYDNAAEMANATMHLNVRQKQIGTTTVTTTNTILP